MSLGFCNFGVLKRLACRELLPAAAIFVCLSTAASAQIINGDFSAGSTGWTSTAPADSTLVYTGGQLTATSDNNGGGASTTLATQTFVAGDPGFLSYLLVSYSSTDVADWDWPLFRINGTDFRLSTTGALIGSVQGAAGAITNVTGASNVSGVTTLTAGSNTVGPGVFSVDSVFGAGIAIWDDIDFQEITISPGAQSVLENNPLTLSGSSAPSTATNHSSTTTVTLSVSSGVINLGSPGSVTISGGADGSSTVTFFGSPTAVNTAMNGLVYTPNLNFTGSDTLVFTASGGGIGDTDNIGITVTPGVRSISVTKTANDTTDVALGQVITYTYVVTNDGDQVISNISLSESHNGSGPLPTPNGETLTADNTPTGDSSDAVSNGSWDTLGPGDEITFTATYTVTQSDIDTLQ